jgi:hypothetical protein
LECLQRHFLWDGPGGEPKLHLVNWKIICSLVLRVWYKKSHLINKGLLGKWLWRFRQEENS